jgi:hypothetical protein
LVHLHASIVFQFHNIYEKVSPEFYSVLRSARLTLILHEPPMSIPPIPPILWPVADGIAIAVVSAVGLIPVATDVIIMLGSMFVVASCVRAIEVVYLVTDDVKVSETQR